MNLLDNLALGLGAAIDLQHVLLLLTGCIFGALAVAIERLGLLALVAMLLPVVQHLDILASMVMLLGIYCGAHAGVSHDPAQQPGAAGADSPAGALAPSATAAPLLVLLAGLVGVAAIVAIAPLLIEQAFRFGPAEYFSLMALGLIASVVLAPGSLLKATSTLVLGMMLAQVGVDPSSGLARFDFDLHELESGIGLVPMAMGVAVIARVSAGNGGRSAGSPAPRGGASRWSRFDLRRQWARLLRGATTGVLLGPVPGGGVRLGGFVASAAEQRVLRRDGAVGVDPFDDQARSAAIAAGVRSSLVPLLAWGLPANASLALVAGVMLDRQIAVGPQLMTGRPDLFWGSIVAVASSSVLLFLIGGPLRRLTLRASRTSFAWLPSIMVIYCCIGAYAVRGSAFDIFVMGAFALIGHWLLKFGCRVGPLVMGFVLGPTMESSLRHALELSGGTWGVLITRPISAGLLLAAAGLLCAVMLPSVRRWRAHVFDHED